MMKRSTIAFAILAFLVPAFGVLAQDKAQTQKSSAKVSTAPKEQNLKEYIKLLREDVRSEKYSVMHDVMQLDPDEAAKFWPIYREYDDELTKVNDLRVASIEEYARTYNQLTDEKADKLIRDEMAYQKQRADLLAKYYERVKQAMGSVTAARFVQVERQLILIIDLQMTSSLPIVGS
jgi:hypothetical protein